MVWEQQVCADYAEAAAIAVRRRQRPGDDHAAASSRARRPRSREGLLTEDEIDAAVRRILRLKFELGLFENPRGPDAERQAAVIGAAEHAALNLEVARRSLVLLRNDGLLPLPAVAAARHADRRARPERRRPVGAARRLGRRLRARSTGCRTGTHAS